MVAGETVPDWVRAALDALPGEMTEGSRRANKAERACVDIVEAALLKDRVGEVFDGCVVDVDERRPTVGTVQLETAGGDRAGGGDGAATGGAAAGATHAGGSGGAEGAVRSCLSSCWQASTVERFVRGS